MPIRILFDIFVSSPLNLPLREHARSSLLPASFDNDIRSRHVQKEKRKTKLLIIFKDCFLFSTIS